MICGKLTECIEGEFSGCSLSTCDNLNRSGCIRSSDTRSNVQCEEKRKAMCCKTQQEIMSLIAKWTGELL